MKLKKTAFLAASHVPAKEVMACYDWATDKGECVISGFSSPMERDVLHFLLKGQQPIIMVIARCLYDKMPEEIAKALADGRMLIISTCRQTRQSRQSAQERNRYVAETCDEIVFAGITEKSSLHAIAHSPNIMAKQVGFASIK